MRLTTGLNLVKRLKNECSYPPPQYASWTILEQLFFYHSLLLAQHSTQFLCDNIQQCYNVNSIILIINLLLQVLQDSQYLNIGVAAHHPQTGGLLNFPLINAHHKRITEPCVAMYSSLYAVLHHQLFSASIGLTQPSE
jgi:hypothetical protein